MTDVLATAAKVISKYRTRDPFEIAAASGLAIVKAPLVEVRGFLQVIRRIGVIYINDALDEQQSRLVCAHELGHWFMHRGVNRVFLDAHTNFVVDKYELEANRFAACLLWSDEDLSEYLFSCSTDQIARALGTTRDTAEYRMSVFRPRLEYYVS